MKLLTVLIFTLSNLLLSAPPLLSVYSKPKSYSLSDQNYCYYDGHRAHCLENKKWVPGAPVLHHPTQLVADFGIACASDNGELKCWGSRVVGKFPSLTRFHHLIAGNEDFCGIENGKVRCFNYQGKEWGVPQLDNVTDLVISFLDVFSVSKERWFAMTDRGLVSFNRQGELTEYPDFPKHAAILTQDRGQGYSDLIHTIRDGVVYSVKNETAPVTQVFTEPAAKMNYPEVQGTAKQLISSWHGVCAINEKKEAFCSLAKPGAPNPYPISGVEDMVVVDTNHVCFKRESGRIGCVRFGSNPTYLEKEGASLPNSRFLLGKSSGGPSFCLTNSQTTECFSVNSQASPHAYLPLDPRFVLPGLTSKVAGVFGTPNSECLIFRDNSLSCSGQQFTMPKLPIVGVTDLVSTANGIGIKTPSHIHIIRLKNSSSQYPAGGIYSMKLDPSWRFGTSQGKMWVYDGKAINDVEALDTSLYLSAIKTPNCFKGMGTDTKLLNWGAYGPFVFSENQKLVHCEGYNKTEFAYSFQDGFFYSGNHWFLRNQDGRSAVFAKLEKNQFSALPIPDFAEVVAVSQNSNAYPMGFGIKRNEQVQRLSERVFDDFVPRPPLKDRFWKLEDTISLLTAIAQVESKIEGEYLNKWADALYAGDSNSVGLGLMALVDYLQAVEPSQDDFFKGSVARLRELLSQSAAPATELATKKWAIARVSEHLAGLAAGVPGPTQTRWHSLNSKLQQAAKAPDFAQLDQAVEKLIPEMRAITSELGSLPFVSRRNSVLALLFTYLRS